MDIIYRKLKIHSNWYHHHLKKKTLMLRRRMMMTVSKKNDYHTVSNIKITLVLLLTYTGNSRSIIDRRLHYSTVTLAALGQVVIKLLLMIFM